MLLLSLFQNLAIHFIPVVNPDSSMESDSINLETDFPVGEYFEANIKFGQLHFL